MVPVHKIETFRGAWYFFGPLNGTSDRTWCTDWIKTHQKSLASPCTFKVFRRHFRIWLNTYGVLSDYEKALLTYSRNTHKELRIRWNTFVRLIMPGYFKGIVYQKSWNGTLYTGLERTLTYKYYFSVILKKFALCVYGEYAKRRKNVKIKHIWVNN